MKNMNKVLAGLMAAGLLLTTGCASTSTNSSSSTSDWYTGPGYDKLYEELGKADVDLSKAEGKLKDILDKVETMDFNAVLTAVDTGKVDIGISGFGYKADRAEQFELSHGYQSSSAAAHHTLLVPAEKADEYKSLADFSGKKIDTQANSLQEMYVTDQIPDADLQKVATLDQAILELQTGKIDAIALDSTTAKNYAETSDGIFVSVYEKNGVEFDLSQYADESGNVAAVKKGETSLIDAVNQVIDSLATSGKYESNLYTDMYYAACDAAGVSPNEE